LPDDRVLILCVASGPMQSADCLGALRQVELPSATRYIAISGKLDTKKEAKTFNVDAGYPAHPPYLQTLGAWANVAHRADDRYQDGYELFCLRAILTKEGVFDYAILLRQPSPIVDQWTELKAQAEGRHFAILRSNASDSSGPMRCDILFNLTGAGAVLFLDLLWELYVTGATSGMDPYRIEIALQHAADALSFQEQFRRELVAT
jgi:hypothetical protein